MAKVNEPKTGRKGGPLSKARKTKIKNELIALAEQGRLFGVNNTELARQHKINRQTLNKLLEEIKGLADEGIPELIKVDILKTYERMKARVMYWWDKCENAPEEEQSFHLEKQVFDQMIKVLKDYRDTLQSLGVLDKASDKLEIEQNITQKQLVINYNVPNGISEHTSD